MKTLLAAALVGTVALDGASAFVSTPVGTRITGLSLGRRVAHGPPAIQMGFFDAIGKAMNDAMTNDENLGKKQNPGFRDGYDGPRKATALFRPGGQKVDTYAGERLGDVCMKAGVKISYGCQKGTCGTCEVTIVDSNGVREKVKTCVSIIPKNAPGDGVAQFQIEMSDSKVALKRQLDWEQVKKAPNK